MKRNLSKILIATMLCSFTQSLTAQSFSLLNDKNLSKDANPVNNRQNYYLGFKHHKYFYANASNTSFAVLQGVAYFAADDGIHGTELWRSDYTAAGTYMIKDISQGDAPSLIESITACGNKIFFTVNRIVYVTDGTESGTMPVPGISYTSDVTTCLTPVSNILYFLTNTKRLWKTDGTLAGTALVIDFGQTYNYSKDYLGQLTNLNGTLFFTTGMDFANGPELWKSDGTAAGTVMVKDINPGIGEGRPSNLTVVKDKLYFSADDGAGIHLWVSDGTSNGTKAVVNKEGVSLPQTTIYSRLDVTPFAVADNIFYFKGNTNTKGNELYKYDITKPSEGIRLVKDIFVGTASSDPANLTAIDTTVYFTISALSGNQQLWKTDGTAAGTKLIKDMGTGVPEYFGNLINANGKLLFSFYTKNNGSELWKSNGTKPGTVMVKDIYAGNHSGAPASITYIKNGFSLFSATDGIKGVELWRTNGDSAKTVLVKNINNTTTGGFKPDLNNSVFFNNKLFFNAYTPIYGSNLYVSDGTSVETKLFKDINFGNSSNASNFIVFKNNIYFSADSLGFNCIYRTDGTPGGTAKISVLTSPDYTIRKMIPAKNYVYVFFSDDKDSVQLWISNGTAAAFKKIKSISVVSDIQGASVGDNLYFSLYDSTHGTELWMASSTPGSAKMLKDIRPGNQGSYPTYFIEYKNKLYFQAWDSTGNSIYVSNGTKTGTKRICAGNGPIVKARNKLFFAGYDATSGNELFISDGSSAGTVLLKDIYQGPQSSNPLQLKVLNNTVYFSASNTANGTELWKSNGTTNGTVLVKDILPGSIGSYPNSLTATDSLLYFYAHNSPGQNVLYVSTGQSAGTKEVNDAGLNGVEISSFIGAGHHLFINGYTYSLGNELYAGGSLNGFASIENVTANKTARTQTLSALITGNPVAEQLNLSIQSSKSQKVQVIITDASGKVLLNNIEALTSGINKRSYPMQKLSSGIYNIQIVNIDGLTTQLKFVK